MAEEVKFWEASPENIWNYRQNHPKLVLRDLENEWETIKERGLPHLIAVARQSMLVRGINKWLKVRRDLIAYKKQIKHRVKEADAEFASLKSTMNERYCTVDDVASGEKTVVDYHAYLGILTAYCAVRERRKVLSQIRGDLKAMCMTNRWQEWDDKDLEDMNSIKASD